MIRTQDDKVIDIVAAAPSARGDMVYVNNGIPTANHALGSEVLTGVQSSRCVLIGSFEVWVFVAADIMSVWCYRFPESSSIQAGSAAILRLTQAIRFYVVWFVAKLANGVLVFLESQFLVGLDRYRVGLVGALAAAKVMRSFEILTSLFLEAFAAKLTRYRDCLGGGVLFWVCALVGVIAFCRAKQHIFCARVDLVLFAALLAGRSAFAINAKVSSIFEVALSATKALAFPFVFFLAPFASFHVLPFREYVFGVDCFIIP